MNQTYTGCPSTSGSESPWQYKPTITSSATSSNPRWQYEQSQTCTLPESKDLLPCPFCKGTNIEKISDMMIGCHDCHVVVKLWGWGFGLNDDIETIWNRREY